MTSRTCPPSRSASLLRQGESIAAIVRAWLPKDYVLVPAPEMEWNIYFGDVHVGGFCWLDDWIRICPNVSSLSSTAMQVQLRRYHWQIEVVRQTLNGAIEQAGKVA